MLTECVYNIQPKTNNISTLSNGKIGKKTFRIISLETTIYHIGVFEKK